MDNILWTGVSAASALLALFGGIALLMLIDGRNKAKERELAHAERMRALELGQPLPDAEAARARSDASRAWARGLSAAAASLGMAGAAVGATALLVGPGEPRTLLPLLCVIWGVCGLVALVAVSVGLASSRRREPPGKGEAALPTPPDKDQSELNAAIREEVSSRSPAG
jgi:hypothetical protein